jgi:hypothetical protein
LFRMTTILTVKVIALRAILISLKTGFLADLRIIILQHSSCQPRSLRLLLQRSLISDLALPVDFLYTARTFGRNELVLFDFLFH